MGNFTKSNLGLMVTIALFLGLLQTSAFSQEPCIEPHSSSFISDEYTIDVMQPYPLAHKVKCPGKLANYDNSWIRFINNIGGAALFSLNGFKGVNILFSERIYPYVNAQMLNIPNKIIFPIIGFFAFEKIAYNPTKELWGYIEEHYFNYPNLMPHHPEFSLDHQLSLTDFVCIPKYNPSYALPLVDTNNQTIAIPGLWGKGPAGGKIMFATAANVEVIANRCFELLKAHTPKDVSALSDISIYANGLYPYPIMWIMKTPESKMHHICE
ncbi:MAG: hypothetical protein K2X39_06700 [Silvanigrellaceae bacterium]|nr:hypothetical protein [Silvanigrellaceae bacterium]